MTQHRGFQEMPKNYGANEEVISRPREAQMI